MTLVHKRKSKLATGTVTLDEAIIGHVERRSRVAAGTGGQCRPFWTATPGYEVDGKPAYGGASLGTRFPTRASAVKALRDWARENSPERCMIAGRLASREWSRRWGWSTEPSKAEIMRRGISRTAESFKRRHFNSHRPRTNIPA